MSHSGNGTVCDLNGLTFWNKGTAVEIVGFQGLQNWGRMCWWSRRVFKGRKLSCVVPLIMVDISLYFPIHTGQRWARVTWCWGVSVGSLILADIAVCCRMFILGEVERNIWNIHVLSDLFHCEPKTAPRTNIHCEAYLERGTGIWRHLKTNTTLTYTSHHNNSFSVHRPLNIPT